MSQRTPVSLLHESVPRTIAIKAPFRPNERRSFTNKERHVERTTFNVSFKQIETMCFRHQETCAIFAIGPALSAPIAKIAQPLKLIVSGCQKATLKVIFLVLLSLFLKLDILISLKAAMKPQVCASLS